MNTSELELPRHIYTESPSPCGTMTRAACFIAPPAGAHQAFLKPVAESLLIAHLVDGLCQGLVADVVRPQRQHAGLCVTELVAFAAGQ